MKENNTFMAHQSTAESDDQIPSRPLDINNIPHPSKDVTKNPSASKTLLCNKEKIALKELLSVPEALEEDSGRERLKQHRVEVAGRVWIPDIWGQEELLKDWIDCTAFDAPLVPNKITMARAALVEEGRRANVAAIRIENSIYWPLQMAYRDILMMSTASNIQRKK